MADSDLETYLDAFTGKAVKAGLDMKRAGQNWAPMRDLVPGSHISLSVRKDQLQVNLNNERDADREQFERLYRDRDTIEKAIGEGLVWEKKDGRKKTAIRVSLDEGYDARSRWEEQHSWAIEMMKAFEREFGRRLRGHD